MIQVLHVVMTYDCKENTCNEKKNTHNYIMYIRKYWVDRIHCLPTQYHDWVGGRPPCPLGSRAPDGVKSTVLSRCWKMVPAHLIRHNDSISYEAYHLDNHSRQGQPPIENQCDFSDDMTDDVMTNGDSELMLLLGWISVAKMTNYYYYARSFRGLVGMPASLRY